jgi:hypothetical protein
MEAEALDELREAGDWYDARQTGLGAELLAAVSEALDRIQRASEAHAPVVGVPADLPVRQVRVRRFPYCVVYLELTHVIRVLAVAHRKRRPGYWLGRLEH